MRIDALLLKIYVLIVVHSSSLHSAAFTTGIISSPNNFRRQSIRHVSTASDNSHSQSTPTQPLYSPLLSKNFACNGALPVLLNLTLLEHRPMGCTIEESLAQFTDIVNEQPKSMGTTNVAFPFVFVSRIQPKSFSEAAGLQVGDVLVGATGLFGEIMDVTDAGIDKIRGLIASCPNDEPLQLQIIRGTNILEEHEKALVELCSQVGSNDDEVDSCILDFLKAGYADAVDLVEVPLGVNACEDSETECLIDNMYGIWANDIPDAPIGTNGISNKADYAAVNDSSRIPSTVKPWSSRSSPSGTFVRDPATGKMRNLDDTQ